ncbi:MAG: flagellar hook assembly protein FlgD [Aquabacterium sp.]|jgi:flagellar basal-body rod modification protein FlgD|uniref:flagellar hook assembly protein FlgD n=1 Tax=Aquabacterium sp. TaxID=1872578 RepID=UPI001B6B278B|nr:flagellar hook capping FlgD N-terminal domain-containing protein [Aquabacterium sp.]MBP7132839.1 flagellar hook assembly protein FlgD [Aquabacterium sp.]MDQ5927153.1 flagellar basal-body rod modification protein FlgD [Pseudomonadota bacterium]
MTTSAISGTSGATGTNKATSAQSATAAANEASDRFLKLLVTQMQNQDPLNPMDNAQVTSQMAQINTVTGIDKLNNTVSGLGSSLAQMQMLQGASLVGHAVLLEGNNLALNADTGKAGGGYELAANAGKVQIEILSSAGVVVDTVTQTNKSAGRQGFEWTPPEGLSTDGMRFKVTAASGNTAVTATPLTTSVVQAINTTNGTLTLELSNGSSTAYSQVKAVS